MAVPSIHTTRVFARIKEGLTEVKRVIYTVSYWW